MGAPPCQSRQRSARELWGTLWLKDFGVDWKLLFQFLGNLAQWGVWRGILLINFFIGGNLLFNCEIVKDDIDGNVDGDVDGTFAQI